MPARTILFLLSASAISVMAQREGYVLDSVQVDGNREISSEKIIAKLGLRTRPATRKGSF